MPTSPETLPNRAILSLTGSDTLALLERLVTNATSAWTTRQARYGALLTPQGKVIADFIAVRTTEGVLLDVASGFAENLAKRLKMFRLRSQVEIELRDDLQVSATSTPDDHSFADPRSFALPHRRFTPVDTSAAVTKEYDTARIAAGMPEQGLDFGAAEIFPAEINMDLHGGVDLKKGCFVGQEVVSRMHRRGNIRKRTIVLHGSGLTPGAELIANHPIGVVTSAVAGAGLAALRIDRLAKAIGEDQPLRVNDNPVTFEKPDWLQAEMAAFISDD